MDTRYTLTLLYMLQVNSIIEGSKILGIFPVISKSHYSLHQVITKHLASQGHEVTVLSFPIQESNGTVSKQSSNYRDISLSSSNVPNFVDSVTIDDAKIMTGLFFHMKIMWSFGQEYELCKTVLTHMYVKDLLSGKIQPPDVILIESFNLPCYALLCKKLSVPAVHLVTSISYPGIDYSIGNPAFPSYIPFLLYPLPQRMTFWQRALNLIPYVTAYIAHHLLIPSKIEAINREFIGMENVNLADVYKSGNVVLYNNHFSFLNRPNVPGAIDIAGVHIKDAQPLPKDIKEFIEGSNEGVIFFSFGSTFKCSSIPAEKLSMFREVFYKVPQRIIWRCDSKDFSVDENKIMLGTWFPQRDILEHPNVKAFISHGGIFGTLEAIHTSTPVIEIPFMFDQYLNTKLLEEHGVAIAFNFDSLTFEELLKAMQDIINDPKYKKNMERLSGIFKDRPMSPVDTACYWIEYVIRHKGAPHLRTAAADMSIFQYFLLDVIIFYLLVFIFVGCVIRYSITSLWRFIGSLITLKKKVQ